MLFPGYELNIAGTEWFIIIIVVVIFIFPTKIAGFSKTMGRVMGEYEKAKGKIMDQKNMLIPDNIRDNFEHEYIGPKIQRPISSEREKLEMIAKSLNINFDDLQDDDLRTKISNRLREAKGEEF